MSDNDQTNGSDSLSDLDPARRLEVMVLLAQRLTNDLATASALTSRSLSVEAFALLANLSADAGSPVAKIGKRATGGVESREARKSLLSAGLVAENKDAAGGKTTLVLTEQGKATIASIRAELAEKVAAVPEKYWRALSRTASLVRSVSQGVSGPRVTGARSGASKAPKTKA